MDGCIAFCPLLRFCNYMNANIPFISLVDGVWSEWEKWSVCGPGDIYKSRKRTCTNPKPEHGGKDCSGSNIEQGKCPITPAKSLRTDATRTNASKCNYTNMHARMHV